MAPPPRSARGDKTCRRPATGGWGLATGDSLSMYLRTGRSFAFSADWGMHTSMHAPPDRAPRDHEIDVYGLTHPGKMRKDNQDHFLICSLSKQMVLRQTSLPHAAKLVNEPERIASLAMVADG